MIKIENELGDIIHNDEFMQKEREFASAHKKDSDEQLLEYIKDCASKLGKCPSKKDVVGYSYIKRRLDPWNRILERAGLKQKSERQIEKERKQTNLYATHKNHGNFLTQAEILKKKAKKLKRQKKKEHQEI